MRYGVGFTIAVSRVYPQEELQNSPPVARGRAYIYYTTPQRFGQLPHCRRMRCTDPK